MKSVSGKIMLFISWCLFIFVLTGCNTGIFGEGTNGNKIVLWNGIYLTGWKVVPEQNVNEAVWSVKEGVLYCQGTGN
jgi:hypothetical protein